MRITNKAFLLSRLVAAIWSFIRRRAIPFAQAHPAALLVTYMLALGPTQTFAQSVPQNLFLEPQLVLPIGHSRPIRAAKVSPNGRYLLTLSDDKTALLWDLEVGEPLRRFVGHSLYISSGVFTPDSMHMITISDDHTARKWNLESGAVEWQITANNLSEIAISGDGDVIAISEYDYRISIWRVADGTFVAEYPLHGQTTSALAFANQSRLLASGAWFRDKGLIQIWDTTTNQLVRKLEQVDPFVTCLAFSPQDDHLLVGAWDRTQIWALEGAETGKPIDSRRSDCGSAAFLPGSDASYVLGRDKFNPNAEVWTLGREDPVSTFPTTDDDQGKVVLAHPLGYSDRLLTVNERGDIRIWSLKDAKQLSAFKSPEIDRGMAIAIAPQGQWMAVARDSGIAEIWSLIDGQLIDTVSGRIVVATADAFAVVEPRTYLRGVSTLKGRIQYWSYREQRVVQERQFDAHRRSDAIALDSRGDALAASSGSIEYLRRASDAVSKNLALQETPLLAVSAEGGLAFVGGINQVFALENWSVASSLESDTDYSAAAFNPGGDLLLVGSEHTVEIFSARTGKLVKELNSESMAGISGVFSRTYAVAFSPDGTLAAAAGQDNTIRIWSVADWSLHREIGGVVGTVFGLAFTPDGKRLASTGNQTLVHDVESGSLLATNYRFTSGAWLWAGQDGNFDTNDFDGIARVAWTTRERPMTRVPLTAFADELFQPGLLKVLNGAALTSKRPLALIDRRTPHVNIESVLALPALEGQARVKVTIRISPSDAANANEAYDLRLFRDGQIVAREPAIRESVRLAGGAEADREAWRRQTRIEQADGDKEFEVLLPAGTKFKLSAYAFNREQVRSDIHEVEYSHQLLHRQRSRAYLVAIGVNRHEDSRLNLSYAENDAKLLGTILEPLLAAQYDVRTATLLSSHGTGQNPGKPAATGESIRAALRILGGVRDIPAPEGLDLLSKAGPDDLVVVYFAGHGIVDSTGEYRLLPTDTGPLFEWLSAPSLKRTISGSELAELLFPIDAGHLVLIVDSCYSSSGVVGDGFRPAPFAGSGLGRMAFDKRMQVLTASKPDAVAMEIGALKQGLLTHVLFREGIERGLAEREGLITLSSALSFARARAPGLHAEELHRRNSPETLPSKSPSVPRVGVILLDPKDDAVLQQPVLFDYSRPNNAVVLRDRRPSKLHLIFDKYDSDLISEEQWIEEVIASLKESEPVNAQDDSGHTVLHRLKEQHGYVLRLLLEAGADPKIRDQRGMTALHAHASWWLMPQLISAGGDAKATANEGLTVLQASLFAGTDVNLLGPPIGLDPQGLIDEISILQALQDKGLLQPNAYNFDGSTLLLRAMEVEDKGPRLRIVNWLLQHGAKPDVAHQNSRRVALGHARMVDEAALLLSHYPSKEAARQAANLQMPSTHDQPMVELLLKYGADINHRGEDGATNLMRNAGSLVMVTSLLDLGASATLRDELGRTSLDWALGRGTWSWIRSAETVRVAAALIAAGANPSNEFRDTDGDTIWTFEELTSAFKAEDTQALLVQMKSMNLQIVRASGSVSSALVNIVRKIGSAEPGELDATVNATRLFLELGARATTAVDYSEALIQLIKTVLNQRPKDYDERIGLAGTTRLQELLVLLRDNGADINAKLDDGKGRSLSLKEALESDPARPLLQDLRKVLGAE